MALLAAFLIMRAYEHERTSIETGTTATARALVQVVDGELARVQSVLQVLATSPHLASGDLAGFYGQARVLVSTQAFNNIVLTDVTGQQRLNTLKPWGEPLPRHGNPEQLKRVIEAGRPVVSDLYIGGVTRRPLVGIEVPVLSEGNVVYGLAAAIFPERLGEVLRRQKISPGWVVSIVDSRGTIVARTHDPEQFVGKKAAAPLLRALAEASEGVFESRTLEGIPVLAGFSRSGTSGWAVAIGVPMATLTADLRHSLLLNAAAAVILLALGGWLARSISQRISRSMHALTDPALALGSQGALPIPRAEITEVDELGQALFSASQLIERRVRERDTAQRYLDIAGVMILVLNADGTVALINRRGCAILGYDSPEQILGQSWIDLCVPERLREALRGAFHRLLGGSDPSIGSYENPVLTKTGDERTIAWRNTLIRDDKGSIIATLSSGEDVTEQRHAEAASRENEALLRDSQQHLALAQRVSHTGSALHDTRTGVSQWSDELFRLFGIEPGSRPASFETFLSLVHPDDRVRMSDARDRSIAGNRVADDEFRVVRPDGEVRVLRTTAEPIYNGAGSQSRLVVSFRDVTELRTAERRQHELEHQLQHAQRLDALGTLAGGIAHDLNNTLVPVLGLATVTMRRLPEGSREHANLATIVRAGERARDLVRQILAFSRKETPTREPIDLAVLTHDALAMIRATIPATVRIDEAIETVPPVLGDTGQLHQVIVNLVVNAAHAIGDAMGTITVALRADRSALPQVGGSGPPIPCVRLSVRDTGCGMEPATLTRIFEPFFTTKRVGEGVGLSLSMVHGIVAQHAGMISVDSRPGEGSRFDIILPALVPQAPALDTATAAE